MFLQETYELIDYWYYTETLPSYTDVLEVNPYYKRYFDTPIALPSDNFEIEFTTIFSSVTTTTWSAVMYGSAQNNYYYQGTDAYRLYEGISRNGTRAILIREDTASQFPANTDVVIKVKYQSGLHTLSYGNRVISATNTEYPPTYLLGLFISRANASVTKIKVKAL